MNAVLMQGGVCATKVDNLQDADHQCSTARVRATIAFLILLINSSNRSRVLSVKQEDAISILACGDDSVDRVTKRARKGRMR